MLTLSSEVDYERMVSRVRALKRSAFTPLMGSAMQDADEAAERYLIAHEKPKESGDQ